MRGILKTATGIILGLIMTTVLSSCTKPHFEVTYFGAAREYALPGDIKVGHEGYVVIAAQYEATYSGYVFTKIADVPDDDWSWRQILPVGHFQNYWFFMFPERYADNNISIEMANSKAVIAGELPLDKSRINESCGADFLELTTPEEWEKDDWNDLVDLTVHIYADNPNGSEFYFNSDVWEGAKLTDELGTFSKSKTLVIESNNNSNYHFTANFSKRLAKGDPEAVTVAMAFYEDPFSLDGLLYYDFRDVKNTYDVFINGTKTGQTDKVDRKAYAEMELYRPKDRQMCGIKNTDSYSFTQRELKAKLVELFSQMQP